MSRTSFNKNWTVKPAVTAFATLGGKTSSPQAVMLPHDAMIALDRSAR